LIVQLGVNTIRVPSIERLICKIPHLVAKYFQLGHVLASRSTDQIELMIDGTHPKTITVNDIHSIEVTVWDLISDPYRLERNSILEGNYN